MKFISNIISAFLVFAPVALNASVEYAPDKAVENASIQYSITSKYNCNAGGELDPAFYPNNIEISVDQSLIQSRLVYEEDQDGDLVIRTNVFGGHKATGSLLPIGLDDQGNVIAKRKIGNRTSETKYVLMKEFFGYYLTELDNENKPIHVSDFRLTERMYSYPVLKLGVLVEGDGRKNLAHIFGNLTEGAIQPDEFANCSLQTTIYKPLAEGEKIQLKLARDHYGNPTLVQVGRFNGPHKIIDQKLLKTASKLAIDIRTMLKVATDQ